MASLPVTLVLLLSPFLWLQSPEDRLHTPDQLTSGQAWAHSCFHVGSSVNSLPFYSALFTLLSPSSEILPCYVTALGVYSPQLYVFPAVTVLVHWDHSPMSSEHPSSCLETITCTCCCWGLSWPLFLLTISGISPLSLLPSYLPPHSLSLSFFLVEGV